MKDNKYVASFWGSYSSELVELLNELKAVKELRVDAYDDFNNGWIDVDVLLEDGRVVNCYYGYGKSFTHPDHLWWKDCFMETTEGIKEQMLEEATFFDNESQYQEWRKSIK